MRDLILLRGAPGSGKSTWVASHHLEPYTVSSDQVRLMFSAPELDPQTGNPHISQRNENAVWQFIEQAVELRMKTGQFIVLDAQNIKPERWLKLADQYRYHVWKKTMDVTLEECLARNAARPVLQQVPEHVILASSWKLGEHQLTNRVKEVPEDVVKGDLSPLNVDNYERVYFIGDLHSCYTALKAFFDYVGGPKDTDLYVFVGDTLDRGLEHKETLEFMVSHRDDMNFMFIAGNHVHEKYWAEDRVDEIRSKEFLLNTMPALDGVDKKAVREWCSRWIQLAYLEFHGKRYFVTHAGVGYMPKHIRYVPTHVYQRGGAYEDDVDRWWCEKNYGPDLIQVHGHRNWYQYAADETETSINLCSAVEFGEPLRVYGVEAENTYYLSFDNPVHRDGMSLRRKADILEGKAQATPNEVAELLAWNLRSAKGVDEKQLKNNVSSFNFTRDVFYSMAWDDLNKIARGLFIDTVHWKILARGFEKFFHCNEHDGLFNSKEWLKEHLQFPVTAKRKYNGFLFMTSWDPYTKDIFYASKSTTEGQHVDIGKRVLKEYFDKSPEDYQAILSFLQDNDVTLLWEICSKDDPHIINEFKNGDNAVLLNAVYNQVKFKTISDDVYNDLAWDQLHDSYPVVYDAQFNSWEELEPVLDSKWIDGFKEGPVEGWVLQDANGYMLKIKTEYYNIWKRLRNLKEALQKHPDIEISWDKWDERSKSVISLIRSYESELLQRMSIIDIREAWIAQGNEDYPYDMKTKQEGDNHG